jgi:hypothetical protein
MNGGSANGDAFVDWHLTTGLSLQVAGTAIFILLRVDHVQCHVTPPHYLKLKKEEVIYKVRFVHKYRVLPLHTACASRASARDHVTWNARTVTVVAKDYLWLF